MLTDRIEAQRIKASEAVRPTLAAGSRVPMVSNDALAMCDRRDATSTELPVIAGGSPFSTGAGKSVGRFTEGHSDNPVRDRTIALAGRRVVEEGRPT